MLWAEDLLITNSPGVNMAGTVSVPRGAKTAAGAAGAAPGTEPPSEYPLARLNLAVCRSFSSFRKRPMDSR